MITEYNVLDKNTIFPSIEFMVKPSNIQQYKYVYSINTYKITVYEGIKYLVKIIIPDIYANVINPSKRLKRNILQQINHRISEYKIEKWMLEHSLLKFIKLPIDFDNSKDKGNYIKVDYIPKDILNQTIKHVPVKINRRLNKKINTIKKK